MKSYYLREYTKNLLRWHSITDVDHQECYVVKPQLLTGSSLFLMDMEGTELAQITPDFEDRRTLTLDIAQDGVHEARFQMKMGFEYESLVTVGDSHWAITGNSIGSQYDITDPHKGILAHICYWDEEVSSEESPDIVEDAKPGEHENLDDNSGFLQSFGFATMGGSPDTHDGFPTSCWIDIEEGEPEILLLCVSVCFMKAQNYQRRMTQLGLRTGLRTQPNNRRR
ncbi:MAG: hypothetical protein FWG15_07265 [Propionibacteriaceae bacterium]|nr:hypothetical protein [Propionibacteriaceae bacterium]